jgi:predicted Zn-dependent protease with MMP-like domain
VAESHDFGMLLSMITVPTEQFEELVSQSLAAIPERLRSNMDNVAVMVDDFSPPGGLLGLYEGVPLTKRGNGYSASVPDRITIFMATICRSCSTMEELAAMVRKTVIHEIGHHFGIDDHRLEELGWA